MAPSLPTEIIQLVFHELDCDFTERVDTVLSVSSVSQHWREVALCTPSLWATFSFWIWTHHPDFLLTFLERSHLNPLNITISFDISHAKELRKTNRNVDNAIALLDQAADRVERLHLRIFDSVHADLKGGRLVHFLRFRSSSLKFFEMDGLQSDQGLEELYAFLWHTVSNLEEECWSDRCPALTHVSCTDPTLIIAIPRQITHLRICGIPGRGSTTMYIDWWAVFAEARSLAELVIDGVSIQTLLVQPPVTLPKLHTLSLRCSPSPDGYNSDQDVRDAVHFLGLLDAPCLASLVLPESNPYFPARLDEKNVCIRGITRLAVVPDSSPQFSCYSTALPDIENLVFLGSDPQLNGIAGLSENAWPNLRMINLTELEPPPSQNHHVFWESIYWYGHRRFAVGRGGRIVVHLPRGLTPPDHLPLDTCNFMDLRLYTA